MFYCSSICALFKHYWQIFSEVWKVRKKLDPVKRERNESEFLPAHLELIDTPVSSLPRWVAKAIMLFFVIAAIWAYLGKVEIVAVAPGKILPNLRSKTIQPIETAIVKQVYVRNGQHVNKGDLLVELTTLGVEADLSQAESALKLALLNQLRQEALAQAIQQDANPILDQQIALQYRLDQKLFTQEQRLANSQFNTWLAEKHKLIANIEQKKTEKNTIEFEVKKYTGMLKYETERRNDFLKLYKKGHASKHELFSYENRVIELENEIHIQQSKIYEINAQLEQANKEFQAFIEAFERDVLVELRNANKEVEQLRLEVEKNSQRQRSSFIYAPVDGSVQQLQTYTIGGVVTTAQPLMTIVPKDEQLEIEVMISNKDIGFVKLEQDVVIKVEAFPYTRYGHINGKLSSLSFDAVQDENLGLIFPATITMEKSYLNVEGQKIPLMAGMAVTTEIKTGSRNVLDYLLSPIKEIVDESLKER